MKSERIRHGSCAECGKGTDEIDVYKITFGKQHTVSICLCGSCYLKLARLMIYIMQEWSDEVQKEAGNESD